MNVVICQDFFPQVGGAHFWIYEIYRRWDQPVRLLTRIYDKTADETAAAARFDSQNHGSLEVVRRDIVVRDISLLSPGCLSRFWGISGMVRQLAASGSPTTVHCLRAFPEGLSGALVKLRSPLSTRLVVFAHGEEILVAKSSRQLRLIASLVFRLADVVIVNSRSTERLVHEIAPGAKTTCIHPGVDPEAFRVDPAAIARQREAWGWSKESVIVSTIARMEPRKNQGAVIRAVAALRRDGIPVCYVCAGAGEEREALEQLASTLGVSEWVQFPGLLTETEKLLMYGASDIFAMPSIHVGEMIEGFGIVFLEAAAAGIPAVCGRIGGQPEAVLDGQTGIVVDGLDDEEVTAAIRRLALDADTRKSMGAAGRVWAARHDWRLGADAIMNSVRSAGKG